MLRGRLVKSGGVVITALDSVVREDRPRELRQYLFGGLRVSSVGKPLGVSVVNSAGVRSVMSARPFQERAVSPWKLKPVETSVILGVPRKLEDGLVVVPFEAGSPGYWFACVVGCEGGHYEPGDYHLSISEGKLLGGQALA